MLKPLLYALAIATCATRAHADARFDFIDDARQQLQLRIGVSGERVRVDPSGANGVYVVLDLKTQTLTQVNPNARTTTSSTVEEVSQIVGSIVSASAPDAHPLLQLAVGSLPPEQRAQIAAMIAQAKRDEAFPYRPTGKQHRVAGIPCRIFEQRPDSGDVRTLCVAAYDDLQITAGDARTLKAAVEILRKSGGPWLRLAEVPGLPIRYSGSVGGGAYAGAGRLQTLDKAPLRAAIFDDPPGYRIVSILEMMADSVAPTR